MKALKNLFTSINARFECMVSELENHEALAASAVREFEKTASRAQMHHRNLKGEINRLNLELQKHEKNMDIWKSRAKQVHGSDEQKALKCVLRYKQATKQAEGVRQRIVESEAIEHQVAQDVSQILAKLHEVRSRKLALACRESCAEAVGHIDNSAVSSSSIDVFDRWEERIIQTEMRSGLSCEVDALEQEFSQAELQDDLATTLEMFINENN